MTENQLKPDLSVAKDVVLNQYIRLAYYIGRLHGKKFSHLYDDCISAALLGLVKSLPRACTLEGDQQKNYVAKTIDGYCRAYIRRETRVPTIAVDYEVVATPRDATIADLSAIGLSQRAIAKIKGVSQATVMRRLKDEGFQTKDTGTCR